jgi:hypothetical protein
MTFRRKFELMKNGIGGFKQAEAIPAFVGGSDDLPEIKKFDLSEKWKALGFYVNDLMNELYGKLKTVPVTAVVIGMILLLIGLCELVAACFGACWRCIRGKPKIHKE